MTELSQNSSFIHLVGQPKTTNRINGFVILFFASAAVFAGANGITNLPESYRTPLSDMVYDDNSEWRAAPDDDNPWREDDEDLIVKPRIKATLFPKYNYDSVENPNPGSSFQNENELDKPVSNIFKYTF